MERSLSELLAGSHEQSLYDVVIGSKKERDKGLLSVNKKYVRLFSDNSVKYCINSKYFENGKKLKKVIYSVIQSAFKDYKQSGIENIEILLNYYHEAERVKKIKKELEDTYDLIATDAGVYKEPFLGEALEFSINNLSVKEIPRNSFNKSFENSPFGR
jgi:pantothenate kinase